MSNETTKVAAVAMHSEMGEPDANLKRVEYWARKAHAKGQLSENLNKKD